MPRVKPARGIYFQHPAPFLELVALRSHLLLSPFTHAMKITRWISLACLACLSLASHAQVNDAFRALKILPAPKEVRMAEGRIVIKPSTTILISNSDDRTAAETLQKEIHDRTGMKLSIDLVTAAPKTAGHISLGRLTDRGLRSYIESQGVKAGDDLGSQGYVIRVADSGVLVAGRTAQGLFYGVQTLRQLLRPGGSGGKMLAVPALVIRDWPSMEWRGVSDDISRGPIPTLDYLKMQIRTLAEYKINLVGFNMEHAFDFIRQVYGEVVPLFPGPFFHIGSDETFELGLGQTKALAAQQGLGRVYLEHLQKVFEIMQPYHKQLMFWGDIAVKYPELLTILPKDMIAVPWDYDPKPTYEGIITPYTNAGLRVVVAPGAGNWRVIWPDLDSAFVNIRNFVRDGQKHRAIGALNTTWNDDGESLVDMTWPALIFGAAASWQPGESSIDDFKKSYDWAFYRNNDDDSTFAGVLEMRDRTKAHLHAETLDDMLLASWHLDTLGLKIQFTSEISLFYWDAYQNQTDGTRAQHDLDEIVDINGRLQSLRDAITEMRRMYAEGWARENQPYWQDNVLVRYDNLAAEVQAKIVAVQAAQRQYWNTKTLPPPEQLGFFLK